MVIGTALFAGLFNNLAIFIVLIALYAWLLGKIEKVGSVRRSALLGGLFGLVAIASMHTGMALPGGLHVDQRNAIIALGGAFGGPIVGIIAAVFAGAYRFYLGGAGVAGGLVGCGLALMAGTLLCVWRNHINSLPKAAAAAAAATLFLLPGFLFIGDIAEGWALLQSMGPSYAAAIFLGMYLGGLLLHACERRYDTETDWQAAVDRLQDFAGVGADWLWETDAKHHFVFQSREPGDAGTLWFDAIESGSRGLKQGQRFFDMLDSHAPFRDFEYSFTGATGNRQTVRISGMPVFDAGGAFAGFRGASSDTTESGRFEAELLRREKQFSDFAAAAFDRFWETDRNHRYVFATDSALILARGGRSGSTFPGQTLWELSGVGPEEDEGMARILDLFEARQPFSNVQIDIRLPDGRVSNREMSGIPFFDEDGGFQGFRGSTRDITEEVRAVTTLRTSEENYRSLAEGSVQGVFIHHEFTPLYANQACAEIFGYKSVEDFMSLSTVLSVWEPNEQKRMDDYRRGRLRGDDVPERFEAEGRRADGSSIWVLTTARVIQWDGKPVVQTTVIDITDRRHAEDALQQSSARMRAILDATPLAIAALDTEMRVTLWTRAAEVMYGWTEAEVLGKSPPNIPAGEQDAYRETSEQARRSRSVAIDETKRTHKDGHLIDVRLFVAPIEDDDGNTVGFLGVAEDITGQKAIEDQLRQSQKMEAIGQLTGGIAHDFNNLLGVIIGNLDFAKDNISDVNTLESLIDNAIGAANRGAELNRHLLAFSRQMPLAPEVIDLNLQVGTMADLLRRTLAESIAIEFVRGEGLWACEADPGQVESALLNLCLNARDAMPNGGHLTIETANCRLDDEYANRVRVFRTKDSRRA